MTQELFKQMSEGQHQRLLADQRLFEAHEGLKKLIINVPEISEEEFSRGLKPRRLRKTSDNKNSENLRNGEQKKVNQTLTTFDKTITVLDQLECENQNMLENSVSSS